MRTPNGVIGVRATGPEEGGIREDEMRPRVAKGRLTAFALRRSVRSLRPELMLVNGTEGMVHTALAVEGINYPM